MPITFANLEYGETFRFASETELGYQGARGPWVKLTPRKYVHEDGGPEHRVGTVNVAVRPVESRRA